MLSVAGTVNRDSKSQLLSDGGKRHGKRLEIIRQDAYNVHRDFGHQKCASVTISFERYPFDQYIV